MGQLALSASLASDERSFAPLAQISALCRPSQAPHIRSSVQHHVCFPLPAVSVARSSSFLCQTLALPLDLISVLCLHLQGLPCAVRSDNEDARLRRLLRRPLSGRKPVQGYPAEEYPRPTRPKRPF